MPKADSPRRRAILEKLVRGFSSHRRIQILFLLTNEPGLDLTQIAKACGINLQTAGEHTRRLADTDLIDRRKSGRTVLHSIAPRGERVLQFLDVLE